MRWRFPAPPTVAPRRVVVTGLGLVSPLGTGVQTSWQALLSRECGITHVPEWQEAGLPVHIAGVVRDALPYKETTREGRFSLLGRVAADEALADAGWDTLALTEDQRARFGVCLGNATGNALVDLPSAAKLMDEGKNRRVNPFLFPRFLPNLAGGNLGIQHGLRGPMHTTSTACASSAHSIGDAFRFIKHGHADVMLAGGTESHLVPLSTMGFAQMKALCSRYNDRPQMSSRPFDADRCGFVQSEGAAILILEEAESAARRGATMYAEVVGYGATADGHHVTQPDGGGARRAMRAALTEAGVEPTAVDYINAHATSTPAGDEVEARAIELAIGSHPYVGSCKAALGHLLGAAGAAESVFTILAIQNNVVPPTINLDNPIEGLSLTIPTETLYTTVDVAMKNSFGFGGTNASLVFRAV